MFNRLLIINLATLNNSALAFTRIIGVFLEGYLQKFADIDIGRHVTGYMLVLSVFVMHKLYTYKYTLPNLHPYLHAFVGTSSTQILSSRI